MSIFKQTFQVLIPTGQPRAVLDIPTRDGHAMQMQHLSATATNAVTSVALNEITTIVESNGFFARPIEGEKPDIAIAPGAVLRVICSRTTVSMDPVRILVAVELAELP
jgi:hypothetical protein